MTAGQPTHWIDRIPKPLVAILLLAGVAQLIYRAAPDVAKNSPDFRTPLLSAAAWVDGQNPYDQETLIRYWRQWGGDPSADPHKYYTPSVYPPTSFTVLAPFVAIRWPAVRFVWLAASIAVTAAGVFMLARLAFGPGQTVRAGLLAAAVLILGPTSVCIQLGQPTLIVVGAMLIAIALAHGGRDVPAGVILGLATALKPQIGGVVLVFYLLSRRWRLGAWTIATVMVIGAASLVRMHLAGVPWLTTWTDTMREVSATGGFNDPSGANPKRFHLINIQLLLHTVVDDRALVRIFTVAVTLGCFVAFLLSRPSTIRDPQSGMAHGSAGASPSQDPHAAILGLSVLLLISLLPVYHRYYDALLLVIPLAWAIGRIGSRMARYAWPVVFLCAPFIVSWADYAHRLIDRGQISQSLANSWFWRVVVVPCQVWAILAMIVCLLGAMASQRRMEAQVSATQGETACPR